MYATNRGIEMNAASLTINGGEVTANGNNNYGIYANSYSYITINGGQVTATGGSGIYASQYSTLTISGGQVTATGNGNYSCGLRASQNSTLTISGGQVTATGNGINSDGILSDNSTLTISGGQVTATGNGNYSCGIYSYFGTLTISGGQVSATAGEYGIASYPNAITLGWTNYSDFILANNYYIESTSTINIAEGKTFIDEDGNTYSGTINKVNGAYPINGKTLYPYSDDAIPYLNENGHQRYCVEYTILTNTMTTLGTADQETWYVADGILNFNQTINVNGVVHLILKDNAVMNVGTNESPITSRGISSSGPSISIYGQSTGSDIGMLSVYATYCGIYDYDYYGNNNNPNYDYAVTINGGNIFVSASSYGIQSNKVTINGGQVSATAGLSGIASYPNAITLGWTSPYDFIFANNYQGDVIVKEGKTFITDDATPIQVSDTISDLSTINGKTLYPYVAITKSIIGYSQGGGWYLIASPVADAVMPTEANGILSNENEFDLYRFNPLNEGNEWENYKAESFNLVNGQGYLYANSNTTTLVFAGVPVVGDTYEVALEYDANDEHQCWNLVGNPFGCNATLNRQYYVLSADGTGINPDPVPATTPVPPCTAVFVKAVSVGDTVVFSKVTQ